MPQETLRDLLAKRDAAFADYEYVATTYRDAVEASTRSADPTPVPDGFEAAYEEHRDAVEALDARVIEVAAAEQRSKEIATARKLAGITSAAVVKDEPRTYGEANRENSWVADMAWAAMPGEPHHRDAVARLNRHDHEMVRDAINDPAQRARMITAAKEHFRGNETQSRRFTADLESRSLEVRAGMDTTGGSGGSFVTPQYLVSQYAPYRQFGRAFADAANKQDLPDYGMTVYLPAVLSPAGVGVQGSQNAGVTETDPTAGYLSAGLVTEAGQVTLSQQLLDRAGPGIQFDRIVFDQCQRAYNLAFDQAVLTAALANAGTIANAATGGTTANIMSSLYGDISKAIQAIEATPGTVLYPTHLFATPIQWAFDQSLTDSNGRPVINPGYAGPFQSVAATSGDKENVVPEGDTGFQLLSLPVFKDPNIPASGSNTQVVVAHMPEVWVWEGPLVPRTIPQTYAQNLSVLLQVYSYNAVIVRYPKAVQAISGNRYPAAPSFVQA